MLARHETEQVVELVPATSWTRLSAGLVMTYVPPGEHGGAAGCG